MLNSVIISFSKDTYTTIDGTYKHNFDVNDETTLEEFQNLYNETIDILHNALYKLGFLNDFTDILKH